MQKQAIYLAKNRVYVKYNLMFSHAYICHTLGNKNYTKLLTVKATVLLLKHRICNSKCEA